MSSLPEMRETQQQMATAGLKTTSTRLGELLSKVEAYSSSQNSTGLTRSWLDASVRIDLTLENL